MSAIEEAFQELYPRALRLARRILGDLTEAEDVAAETMARAFSDWSRVASLPYRDAWVLRVATNLALDASRRPPVPTMQPEQVEFEEAVTLRLSLADALRALPERQREAIALRYFADMSQAEVAHALGISAGTVATHTHRALRALRVRLEEAGLKITSIAQAKELIGKIVRATVLEDGADIGMRAVLAGERWGAAVGDDVDVTIEQVRDDKVFVTIPPPPEVAARRREFVGGLNEGDRLHGHVRSIVRFGAFVEVAPDVYGLVHESELSRAVAIGEEVTVQVLATAPDRGRVSFTLVSYRRRSGSGAHGGKLRRRSLPVASHLHSTSVRPGFSRCALHRQPSAGGATWRRRRSPVSLETPTPRRRAHRVAVDAGHPADRAELLSAQPQPQQLPNLDHAHLPEGLVSQ